MKYNLVRDINMIVCIAIVIVIMICAYKAWSQYGEYTIMSFITSLIIHGSFGTMIYFGIDYVIRKLFKKEE